MLSRILTLFSASESKGSEAPSAKHDGLQLAVCVLMLEVATVDDEFSPEERTHIVDTLRDRFSLAHSDAAELMELAEHTRNKSADLWKFTNHINTNCSVDEKLEILEEVWRVIYADGELGGHEDYIVHKLAKLLNLAHPELIRAKMAVIEERKKAD